MGSVDLMNLRDNSYNSPIYYKLSQKLFYWEKIMTCGIYKIENKINGKSYIGQSANIERRWKDHKTHYKINDEPLYNEMKLYGIENFEWSVIEECDEENLLDR